MTKLKKMTAVLLSAVMLVCSFSVQAGAKSIYDDAVKLSPMETVSEVNNTRKEKYYYYKINLSDSGNLSVICESYSCSPQMWIMDSSGNPIYKKYSFTDEFNIEKKGTYYIKIRLNEHLYSGYSTSFTNLYYTFTPDHTPTISLALNVKVGDELDFSALASNYTGKVTYKTTDSKVATVDKGKVTCKKAGKAKIRAYMNNGDYAEITLVVKKK